MKTYPLNTVSKPAWALVCLWAALSVAGTGRAQVVNNNPGTSAITFQTQQVETGPVLDVVPDVLSDGYTVNLTLIPSDTEFIGYQNPPNIPSVTGNLNVVQLPIVLPAFTVKQVVTTVNIWDNQTVVIGGLISSDTAKVRRTRFRFSAIYRWWARSFKARLKRPTKRT